MILGRFMRVMVPVLVVSAMAGGAQASTHKTTRPAGVHRTRLIGYQTLSAAKLACGGGVVVWHARGSKVFHMSSSRYFGKTKHGAYMCRKTALTDHLHAAKG